MTICDYNIKQVQPDTPLFRLLKSKKHDDRWHREQLLNKGECSEMIKAADRIGLVQSWRTSTIIGRLGLRMPHTTLTSKIRKWTYDVLQGQFPMPNISPVEIVRYDHCSAYWHFDHFWRRFSVVVPLSDHDDFIGGHLTFNRHGKYDTINPNPMTGDLRIVLQNRGEAILWQNSSDKNIEMNQHSVSLVTGVRYAAVCWAEICPIDTSVRSGVMPEELQFA